VTRLFVAAWTPEDIAAELASLRRKDQRGVRFVAPENWHITLRFLGDADVDVVAGALEGVPLPPTRAHLGPAIDVVGGRAVVVPVRGVDALATVVSEHTAHIGDPPRKRFVGHLTLARVTPRAVMPPVLGELFAAEFDIHEIALVRSRLDPSGARYRTVRTFPVG
jgi:2'-5' RNA ligase